MQQPEEPSAAQKVVAFKEAFWKFLRPHTIRGTILGSSAVTAIALLENTGVSSRVARDDLWGCDVHECRQLLQGVQRAAFRAGARLLPLQAGTQQQGDALLAVG